MTAASVIARHAKPDHGSCTLHAEHLLCEARSDLHRAIQRSSAPAEIDACRRAFRAALTRYVNHAHTEYDL